MNDSHHSKEELPVGDISFNISFLYTTQEVYSSKVQLCKKLIFYLYSIRTESNRSIWFFFLIFWPRLTSWYLCVWSKKWPQCNQQEKTTLSRYGKNKDIRITTVFPIANLSVNSESSQHITMPITCFSVFFLSYTLIYRAPQQVTRTQWPIKKKIAFSSQARLVFVWNVPLRYTVYLHNLDRYFDAFL